MSRSIPAESSVLPAAGIKLASGAPRWLYFAIFAISGFSGLIYESIWSHYLKLFLGHAAYAQSLVLMIFMGGLAAGSWLAARFSERWRAPILCYAIVEGVIGVIALVFHDVFASVSDAFYFSILPGIGSPAVGNALKWTAAASLIVPQSVLLGMTFPLMSTGILRRFPDHPGGSLAMLYFTNSIGAAIGVLASGFWLIGLVGLPGTIMTAGLLNIALAVTVWVLVKLDPQPSAPAIAARAASKTASADGLAALFFFAAAVTGASSFMYEIGWIRMLSLVLGGTTHSFELMLSAFITGLAFGGLWIKRRIDRIDDPVRFSGWVQVWMGVLAISTLPLYVQTFDWMAALLSGLQRTEAGYNVYTAFSHGLALLVMVPTTFLAGMTLPLFTHVLMRGHEGERAIGRVYAANTVGAIAGVVFAVHIGLPLLGLKVLIVLGAALDVLLGLLLLQRSAQGQGVRGVRSLVAGAVVGVVALVAVSASVELDPRRLSSGVYRYQNAELASGTNVIFYEDGKTASISLSVQDAQITISTNGKPDATIQMDPDRPRTMDEITMVMAASLPLAYHPQARRVANIGLGSGLTAHTFLADPSLERVDTIEIEAAMAVAAQGFGERVARTFTDRRSAIHLEDAKTFFSLQNRAYDIIVAEPSNPWVSGVASLFSDEFYRSVRNYLSADGVFVQWLQLYEFNDDLVLSVFKSLSKNFADYAVYHTDSTNILIVAKASGALPEPSFEHLFVPPLETELSLVGLKSPDDFLVRKSGSKKIVDSLLARSTIPANSDYFPFLDLNAGKARFLRELASLFRGWTSTPLPVLDMLEVADFDPHKTFRNSGFERTVAIDIARSLHHALTTDVDLSSLPALTPAESNVATVLRLLRDSCGQADPRTWEFSLHRLALSTLASLDAPAATQLVDAVAPPECVAQTSPRQRAWLELYRAVASRNPTAMAQTAEALLAATPALDPSERLYALVAAMLGRLVEHRPELAVQLWERYRAPNDDPDATPEVRLILSMALDDERSRSQVHQ